MHFWALDDLVLNNGRIDDLYAWSDDLLGLPKTKVETGRRYGRHPRLSGIERRERRNVIACQDRPERPQRQPNALYTGLRIAFHYDNWFSLVVFAPDHAQPPHNHGQ